MERKDTFEFVKMTGAGNDFVLVDNRAAAYSHDWPRTARLMCDRRYGIGADGLLVIEKSERADFRMNYYNADGSYGGMCGNGGRCAAYFAMTANGSNAVSFEALGNIHTASLTGSTTTLSMTRPTDVRLHQLLKVGSASIRYHFVNTGSPHAVFMTDELPPAVLRSINEDGLRRIGQEIRMHEDFSPEGTNVDFIRLERPSTLSMRTYERGVEDETLACGTGSIASAIIASLINPEFRPPVTILTRGGETLVVDFQRKDGSIDGVLLRGPAVAVFTGLFPFLQV